MTDKITAQIATIEARIAKDTASLADLKRAQAAAALMADVGQGFTVTFKAGRAETRREVTGLVLGRGEVKGVDSVRVQSGEGFDIELHTVKVAELLAVVAPGKAVEVLDQLNDGEDDAQTTADNAVASDDILAEVLG